MNVDCLVGFTLHIQNKYSTYFVRTKNVCPGIENRAKIHITAIFFKNINKIITCLMIMDKIG